MTTDTTTTTATRRQVLAFIALADAPMPDKIYFDWPGDGEIFLEFSSYAGLDLWRTVFGEGEWWGGRGGDIVHYPTSGEPYRSVNWYLNDWRGWSRVQFQATEPATEIRASDGDQGQRRAGHRHPRPARRRRGRGRCPVSGRHAAGRLPWRTRALSWWAGVGQPAWRRWARRIDMLALFTMPLMLIAVVMVTIGLPPWLGRVTPRPTSAVTGPPYRLYQPGLAWLPSGYQFKYADAAAAHTLAPYVDPVRAQLGAVTGVPFGVAATYGAGGLVEDHDVFVLLEYRPCSGDGRFVGAGAGAAGESCGFPSVDGSTLTGGTVYLDSEYWNADGTLSGYGESAAGLRNLVTHEIGHALGLAHPNAAGINSTAGDCVRGGDGGELPVMCSGSGTVGGYTDDRAGEYVQQYDVQGLRQLAANGGATLPAQGAVHGNAGQCLDVDTPGNVDIGNGRKVQLWACNGAPQQTWILAPDHTWRVLGRCLDDYANGAADGNPVVVWQCNGTAWQHWQPQPNRTVRNLNTGGYLDDQWANPANGTPVWLWHYTGTAAQLWTTP